MTTPPQEIAKITKKIEERQQEIDRLTNLKAALESCKFPRKVKVSTQVEAGILYDIGKKIGLSTEALANLTCTTGFEIYITVDIDGEIIDFEPAKED